VKYPLLTCKGSLWNTPLTGGKQPWQSKKSGSPAKIVVSAYQCGEANVGQLRNGVIAAVKNMTARRTASMFRPYGTANAMGDRFFFCKGVAYYGFGSLALPETLHKPFGDYETTRKKKST